MANPNPEKKTVGHSGDTDKQLCKHAGEAAEKIVSTGLMTRHGQVGPGTNNVQANKCAKTFSRDDLARLSHSSERGQGFGQIIGLRQEFMALSSSQQCWGSQKAHEILQKIADQVEKLKNLGWKPKEKSVSLNPN